MNKILSLLAIFCVLAGAVSCKNRKTNKEAAMVETSQAEVPDIAELITPAFTVGDSIMLSSQKLTSWEKMFDAFDNGKDGDFLHESTPADQAFFLPEPDISDSELSRNVMLRHNYCAVMNRVLHSYEWFQRMATEVVDEDEAHTTKRDTLKWIRESQPKLDDAKIAKVLRDGEAIRAASGLVDAYRRFDGNDAEGSPFHKAFVQLREVYDTLPVIVTEEELQTFSEEFWSWYDKEKVVPGISGLICMNMHDYKGQKLSEEQVKLLARRVKSEKDIDKRTILALELVKFDGHTGAVLLGDILESGIYTRYLLEAWISWRANTQMDYSPSSFSVIPNIYYDRLRVKCLNTMLRHCQKADDYRARCLMENLIICEIVHRMGSIAGNTSFTTCMHLSYDEFIHPILLPKDEE